MSNAQSDGFLAITDYTHKGKAKFELGQVVMTPGAIEALDADNGRLAVPIYLARYQSGDWGVTGKEDCHTNDMAIVHGDRILAAYVLPYTKVKFWIITEWDRSATTFLLPEEY